MCAHPVFVRDSCLSVLVAAVLCVSANAVAEQRPATAMDRYVDVVREAAPGLPGYTIYRPAALGVGPARAPVIVWSNGACAASNDSHLYFLTQVAARGFVVIAYGAPDSHSSPGGTAREERLASAIDWVFSPPGKGGPPYFKRLDRSRVATAGHSCGGIDALRAAANDDRVETVVSMNSGCYPESSTGGLSGPLAVCRDHLHSLRGPALFIVGGPADVAYTNALENYELVSTVPAVLASHESAGHAGFFGSASRSVQLQAIRAVVEWLDGALNANEQALEFLVGPDAKLGELDGWTVAAKGF